MGTQGKAWIKKPGQIAIPFGRVLNSADRHIKNIKMKSKTFVYLCMITLHMPEGSLSNGVQRTNGKAVIQKYAAEI